MTKLDKLIDKVEAIMSQEDQTDDDIIELARIKWFLAKETKVVDKKANTMEEEYNLSRGAEYVKIKAQYKGKGSRITNDEAERRAKAESERKFGKFRTGKAEAKSMYASLKALEQYIITLQSKKKNERDASGYDMEKVARMGPITGHPTPGPL